MSSRFGQNFCITTFGESHSTALGVVIDGCPPGIKISWSDIKKQLQRRRPGQSHITTPRKEQDDLQCLSGVENGYTLGSPIALKILNQDQRPQDYQSHQNIYRPSHADYTYHQKYRILAKSGGGRASARETAARVAAGSIAEQCLKHMLPHYSITAYVTRVGDISAKIPPLGEISRTQIDASLVRCADIDSAQKMIYIIEQARKSGDSLGGEIRCEAHGIPAGLGEPIFDKLEADLAKAMMSLPATRYFSMGEGFLSTTLCGSKNNDALHTDMKNVYHTSNRCGGIEGGISNGSPIYFSVGWKPPSSIAKPQHTINHQRSNTVLSPPPQGGRHDPCVLPRAVPIVEAMTSCVLLDHLLRQSSIYPQYYLKAHKNPSL